MVWGLLEPIDQRLFRWDYSDVAVLGKAFTRGPAWRPLGFAVHALNGAAFGLAYHEVARRVPREDRFPPAPGEYSAGNCTRRGSRGSPDQ